MQKIIPYGHHFLDNNDIQEVVKVLKSEWITQGPKISEFEKKIAKFIRTKFAVAVNSGTSALIAACFAANVQPGDEVITTPFTFAASSNCFVWFGAKPVFVDVDEKTLNIDVTKIEPEINEKTKAIVTVDFAGLPCDYDKILEIAKEHKLVLIDDASHALGSRYHNKMIGAIADMTIFSFHPVKAITTGEGGMTVTNNKDFYQRLLLFRSHGTTKDARFLRKNQGSWYYEMQELGFNFRLTDIQAALGISQLKKIDKFIKRRREIVEIYNKAFVNLPIVAPNEQSYSKSAWHLYPVRLKLEMLKVGRRKIFDELRKAGLGIQVHYIPIHLHPYYRMRFGFKRGDFPVAESVYESELSLPLFPKITNEEINFVIKTFRNVIQKYQK